LHEFSEHLFLNYYTVGFGLYPERNDPLPFFQRYVVNENKRPPIAYIEDDITAEIVEICWKKDPNERPFFKGNY